MAGTFEGPGQGAALEDHGLPMIPEWERPVAAVLDHYRLDDVTIVGESLGGGLVIRAAAFEPRISRVVSMDHSRRRVRGDRPSDRSRG